MIGIGKLKRLAPRTRLRKIASILQGYEMALGAGREVDIGFLGEIGEILRGEGGLPESVRGVFRALSPAAPAPELIRLCNLTRHALLTHLGAGPADWDFLSPKSGGLDGDRRALLPITLYLDDLRSPFNVGSVFRSAEAFGVSAILLSDATPSPDHPRARRASMGATEAVRWSVASPADLEAEEGLFALETGGTPLESFRFPERGVLVVGSEELGVSPELLALADRRLGRVSIPLLGAKASLNVGHAVSIVLYRWTSRLVSPNA